MTRSEKLKFEQWVQIRDETAQSFLDPTRKGNFKIYVGWSGGRLAGQRVSDRSTGFFTEGFCSLFNASNE